MSTIAERIAKFQGGSAPTPENQKKKISEEQQKQQAAVAIARARAARYNMTLRSLSLKTAQDSKKLVEMERKKLQEAKAKASKYNATQRALQMHQNRPTKKQDIDNINRALNKDVTPQIAKEVMEVVAINEMSAEEMVAAEVKKSEDAAASEEAAEDEQSTDEVEKGFEFQKLEGALASGNDGEINSAILTEFLEIHAPHELDNVDDMLKQYEGKEQELFDYYVQKYPSPMDAQQEGIIKADDEVFGKQDEEEQKEATGAGELPIVTEEEEQVGIDEDDEDGQIAAKYDQEKAEAYEKAIKEAEEDEEKLERNSQRYESRVINDEVLTGNMKAYKEARESLAEVLPTNNEGYILTAKLQEAANDSDGITGGAWSVQVKSPAQVLKEKLVEQGLSKEKAEALANNMDEDENMSEMM